MNKKILVIDDELELVKAIEVRLKANGCEVEVAYDGATGIEKAKEIEPNLILLDVLMPNMNGYEVAKELKAEAKTKDIPIIILSASQRKDLEEKCKTVGVTKFIMKPFETEDLLAAVNKVFES